MKHKTTAITALVAALLVGALSPAVVVADGHSPVDAMLDDEDDGSLLASTAERVGGAVNGVEYRIDGALSGEEPTTASEQAKQVRDAFNNRSGWVSYYNSQGYPADTSWKVISITYEGEDSSETDYLVLSYDSSGDVQSAEMVDTHDGDVDAEQTVSGALVHSYDDTREAHELVKDVHSDYVTTGDDITEDTAFLGELAKEYAGHTEGDLSP